MADTKVPVNRTLTGILAVLLTTAGLIVWFGVGGQDALAGALIRTGVLLGALWLALPSRTRKAAWANVSPVALIVMLVAAVAFVARPRLLLFAAPVALVLGVLIVLLRPRPK